MSIINPAEYMGLVYCILKELKIKSGHQARDECESAGMYALVQAVDRHKPGLGEFANYASICIRGKMLTALKKQSQHDSRLNKMAEEFRLVHSREEKDVFDVFDKDRYPNGYIICINCSRSMMHKAKRLCSTCYKKTLKNEILCKGCKEKKKHHAHGYCKVCYHKNFTNMIQCSKCNKTRRHSGKGMCKVCYYEHKKPSVICVDCGEDKVHEARGRCRPCYDHYRREQLKIPKIEKLAC